MRDLETQYVQRTKRQISIYAVKEKDVYPGSIHDHKSKETEEEITEDVDEG